MRDVLKKKPSALLTRVRHLECQERARTVEGGFDGPVPVANHDQFGQVQDASSQVHGFAEVGLSLAAADEGGVAGKDGGRQIVDAAHASLKQPGAADDVNLFALAHVFGQLAETPAREREIRERCERRRVRDTCEMSSKHITYELLRSFQKSRAALLSPAARRLGGRKKEVKRGSLTKETRQSHGFTYLSLLCSMYCLSQGFCSKRTAE